jgi:NUMOD3 motif
MTGPNRAPRAHNIGQVLVDETIAKFGYDPRLLCLNSGKIVVAACNMCGGHRTKKFRAARQQPTCLKCSNRANAMAGAALRSLRMKTFYAAAGRHPLKGRGHSEAAKQKMSRARTGKKLDLSAETRKRLSDHCMNVLNNPERSAQTAALNRTRTGPLSPSFGKPPAHTKKVWHVRLDGSHICFRSTWEAAYARFLDRESVDWQYESETFVVEYELNGVRILGTYTPDFKTIRGFVEIKGRWTIEGLAKFNAFVKQYPQHAIILIESADMLSLGLIDHNKKVIV